MDRRTRQPQPPCFRRDFAELSEFDPHRQSASNYCTDISTVVSELCSYLATTDAYEGFGKISDCNEAVVAYLNVFLWPERLKEYHATLHSV